MGVRSVLCRSGMCDSDPSGQRIGGKRLRQIIELSFGAPPFDMPVDDGRDARRVIAAILQPPQPFDQPVGYLVLAQNADDAAHDYSVSVRVERSRDMLAPVPRLRSGRTGAANINPWPFSVPPSLRGTSRPSQAYSPAARARRQARRPSRPW